MAPQDKQERRLARQRGAGPRELKDAAFAFSFGAPALDAPQSPQKPQQLPPKTTPQAGRASPTKTPVPTRPSTAKRKRGNSAASAGPSTSKPAQTPAPPPTADDLDELSPDQPVQINEDDLPQLRRISIPVLPLNRREERPAPSPDRRPPREERGRSRTRKSIVSVSYSQSRSGLDALDEEDEEEADATAGEQASDVEFVSEPTTTPITSRPSMTAKSTARRTSATLPFDGGTSAFLRNQAAQSTRREVFEPTEEAGPDDDELMVDSVASAKRAAPEIDIFPDADAAASDDEDADELSFEQDATTPLRTPLADRNANIPRSQTRHGERALDDAEDDELPSPPQQEDLDSNAEPISRPRKKQKTTQAPITTRKPRIKHGGPTIPITIYRRTKPHTSNLEANEEDEDIDPLSLGHDPTPTLHPPFILNQITSEIITTYINSVPSSSTSHPTQTSSQSKSKSSAKTSHRQRIHALTKFRDTLSDSLRRIGFAQIAAWRFASDVRAGRRRKRELREELMGRRRERERLEREVDEVRRGHLRAEAEAERRAGLVEGLEGIREAVRRGREVGDGDVGWERSVEGEVQDVVRRVGVLSRIREFNGELERAVGML